MKVVFVTKYFYPTKRASGLSDFVYNLGEFLSSKIQLTVISAKTDELEADKFKHKGFWNYKVKGNFPLGAARRIRQLKPDLVWIFSGVHNPNLTPIYFLPIKLAFSGPVILQQTTHFSSKPANLLKFFWQKYSQIIVTHPKIKNQLAKIINSKIEILPPAISLKLTKFKNRISQNKLTIGFFGYLDKIKGVDLAIKTFNKINPQNARLLIAGLGPWENQIKKSVCQNPKIEFKGFLKKPQLLNQLGTCDLIIMPYRTSKTVLGYSYLALEAMAMGVPVLASNLDIFNHLITNWENGLLFKTQKELENNFQKIISHPSLLKSMALKAQKTIKQDFNLEIIGNKYFQIIQQHLAQAKKIQKYYDKYASWYDKERTGKYYSVINELEFQAIAPYLSNRRILEAGCGTGIILKMASQKAKKAVGLDLSPEMVKVTRQKGLEAVVGSVTKIPFKNNYFDLIYSFKVLAHVPEIEKAVQELARATKINGKLVLEFYNPYSLKFLTNKIQKLITRKKVYIRYDNLKKIKSYLPKNLKIIKIKGVRVITPFNFIFKIPMISPIFKFLEKKLLDSFLKYFGSYFIVIIKKVKK